MKKFFVLLLTIILGVLIYMTNVETFRKMLAPSETPQVTMTDTTQESSTTLSVTTETTEETSGFSADNLFNEKFVTKGDYPLSSRPENIPSAPDLLMAVDLYYQETYTEEFKAANQTKVTEAALKELEDRFANRDLFEGLEIKIDQVSLVLDSETVYIPRVIVPINYQNAEKILPENDIVILNEAMTYLGNRLLMIGYFDPQTQEVTIYHLTNWTTPLFTYTVPVEE